MVLVNKCACQMFTPPGESIKRPGAEKVPFPEHQSNYVENCLVLFLICPIRLGNLPGFNRFFLPDEMRDFLKKPLSKTFKGE